MAQTEHRLYDQLAAAAQAAYPLHMPGHKRQPGPVPGLPYAWDTTETPATDDLHDAGGILAQAMARTAALCGAARTWYLVNGSTGGLLAAVRALAPAGGTVICARNCHKAVYHAIELGGLHVRWLTPPLDPGWGIYGSVTPDAVAAALQAAPTAACVILTSPTYEGVLSDIAGIAAVCHARGVPLLVDEAHGAHYLPLAQACGWRGGALAAGADVVVQSPHKTLPSLTQTALLHLGAGSLADPEEIERQLDVFETSSPSYPLLASLDGCTGLLAARGAALFAGWRARLDRFYQKTGTLRRLRVLEAGCAEHPAFWSRDDGKILVDGRGAGLTGAALAQALRARRLEPEMQTGTLLLAMTSLADAADALDNLAEALAEVEVETRANSPLPPVATALPAPGAAVLPIAAALRRPHAPCPAAAAAGRTAAEYVWAYPPGVPLLAPGERITPAFLAAADALEAAGTRLHHTRARLPGSVETLAEE